MTHGPAQSSSHATMIAKRATQTVIASNANHTMTSLVKDRKSIDALKKPTVLASLAFKPQDGSALATKAQTQHSVSPPNRFCDDIGKAENVNRKLSDPYLE